MAGASGALAREVLAVMQERKLPVSEVLPFASESSLGEEIEFQGEVIPVQAGLPSLRGVDLLLLCTPRAAALELVREALRAEVFCIDCSATARLTPEQPAFFCGTNRKRTLIRN